LKQRLEILKEDASIAASKAESSPQVQTKPQSPNLKSPSVKSIGQQSLKQEDAQDETPTNSKPIEKSKSPVNSSTFAAADTNIKDLKRSDSTPAPIHIFIEIKPKKSASASEMTSYFSNSSLSNTNYNNVSERIPSANSMLPNKSNNNNNATSSANGIPSDDNYAPVDKKQIKFIYGQDNEQPEQQNNDNHEFENQEPDAEKEQEQQQNSPTNTASSTTVSAVPYSAASFIGRQQTQPRQQSYSTVIPPRRNSYMDLQSSIRSPKTTRSMNTNRVKFNDVIQVFDPDRQKNYSMVFSKESSSPRSASITRARTSGAAQSVPTPSRTPLPANHEYSNTYSQAQNNNQNTKKYPMVEFLFAEKILNASQQQQAQPQQQQQQPQAIPINNNLNGLVSTQQNGSNGYNNSSNNSSNLSALPPRPPATSSKTMSAVYSSNNTQNSLIEANNSQPTISKQLKSNSYVNFYNVETNNSTSQTTTTAKSNTGTAGIATVPVNNNYSNNNNSSSNASFSSANIPNITINTSNQPRAYYLPSTNTIIQFPNQAAYMNYLGNLSSSSKTNLSAAPSSGSSSSSSSASSSRKSSTQSNSGDAYRTVLPITQQLNNTHSTSKNNRKLTLHKLFFFKLSTHYLNLPISSQTSLNLSENDFKRF
jgi:hypothetical protein